MTKIIPSFPPFMIHLIRGTGCLSFLVLCFSAACGFAGETKSVTPIKTGPNHQGPAAGLLSTPFEIALVTPLQMVGSGAVVSGLRLNLIYGSNASVRGLDLGFMNDSKGNACGLQFGISNSIGGKYSGIQGAIANYVNEDFCGIQFGSLNVIKGLSNGVQVGLVNCAESMGGLQVGVFNIARSMRGVQLGLINFRQNGGGPLCLPILNASF